MLSQLTLPTGTYIIAVSGGVDSVVLLDLLSKQKDLELVVAHFDHGIRHNSHEDAEFVETLAKKYNLLFELERVELGPNASEADARHARYNFLDSVTKKYTAAAVVTAHHQDDVIETGMMNILRGTGRHGLTSLKSRPGLTRPLLHFPKTELIAYAKHNNLTWHEDETNNDTKYLRNKIRLEVITKMNVEQRALWLQLVAKAEETNEKLDRELQFSLKRGLHKGKPVLSRSWFIMLPHNVAKEVLHTILRANNAQDIDRKTIERLTVQIKTLPTGKVLQATGLKILLTKRSARFRQT